MLHGSAVMAAARRQERSFFTVGDGPIAAAPGGADPALYAANPVLYEMRRDRPALVQAAMADDPNPPTLFESGDLPPFTAWAAALGARRAAVAAAPPRRERPGHAEGRLRAGGEVRGRPGPGPHRPGHGTGEPALRPGHEPVAERRHHRPGQCPPGDYTAERLHAELFGGHSFEAPRPAI